MARDPPYPSTRRVGGRREEAAHDRGVRALELDPVESSLGAMVGDEGVAVDDLADLVGLDRLGHFAEEGVGDGARRPHREAGVHARGLAAVVVDLGEDRDVVGVHRIGDPPVAVDHLRPESVDELLVGPVGRVGGVLLGHDESGPARRTGCVVGGVLFGGQPVGGVVGQVGREDDAVGHGHRPEPEGREEVAVLSGRAHGRPLSAPTRPRRPSSCARSRTATRRRRGRAQRWSRPRPGPGRRAGS